MRVSQLTAFALTAALFLMPPSASAADLTPGASKLLVVPPAAFKDACLADIAKAKQFAEQFKGSAALNDPVQALDLYDSAVSLLADAAARASLSRSVHPDEAMRDAAAVCETDRKSVV